MFWSGHPIAVLASGPSLARPRVVIDPSLACLDKSLRDRVQRRLDRWLSDAVATALPPLTKLATLARDPAATPALRSVAAALEAGAGFAARLPLRAAVEALDPRSRKALRQAGVTIGALDLFAPALLKPAAAAWRRTLLGSDAPLPPDGATVLPRGAAGAVPAMGFRPLGRQAVRIDLVERIARQAHDARQGRRPFAPDPALAVSMGLQPATLERLLAELGFRAARGAWVWRGRPPARRIAPPRDNAFAALAELVERRG